MIVKPASIQEKRTYQIGQLIAITLLFLGILLRLLTYLHNRALFLDEANVARNIVEQSFFGFLSPLDYHQYAPPLFCVLEKISTNALGANEYALRLFPLLFGLGLLCVFFLLCKQTLRPPLIWWFPVALLVFSTWFIRYATEAKQYGSDAFATCLLLYLALQFKPENFNWNTVLRWSLLGSVLIWFSMPSVFLLSGVGLYLLFSLHQKHKQSRLISLRSLPSYFYYLLAIGISWLLSFGSYFKLILSTDLQKDYLLDYHLPYFIPLIPSTIEEFQRFGSVILSLFNTTIGYTIYAYIIGIGLFLLGFLQLYRKDKAQCILFLAPILSAFLASALHLYSLMPRLSLFLIPIFILVIAKGVEYLWERSSTLGYGLITVVLVSTLPMQSGFKYFFQPFEIEEIREVLVFINSYQQEKELVYMHTDAVPAWQFYQHLHDNKAKFKLKNIRAVEDYQPVDWVINEHSNKKIWLVFSHILSDFSRTEIRKNRAILEKSHTLEHSIELEGAAAYFYRPKN